MSDKKLLCGTHGEASPAFVCGHVFKERETPLGFFEPDYDPEDFELQGWCQACEDSLQRDGDWTEETEAEADIRVVCEFCFAKIRQIHSVAP